MSEERSPKEISGLLQLACAVHHMDPRTRHVLLDAAQLLDDYAALLARHNALREAAKGLIAIHRRHKDLVVYSDQDYIDIWSERVDALAALVGGGVSSMIPKNVHEAALRAKNGHIKRLEDATRALVENFDADLLLSRIRQGTTAEELLEAERDALRARVARLEGALKFVLDECDWEESANEGGGDNRIGPVIRRALEEK